MLQMKLSESQIKDIDNAFDFVSEAISYYTSYHGAREDVLIYIPEYFIERIKQRAKEAMGQNILQGEIKLFGYKVYPNYENSVVVYCKQHFKRHYLGYVENP